MILKKINISGGQECKLNLIQRIMQFVVTNIKSLNIVDFLKRPILLYIYCILE